MWVWLGVIGLLFVAWHWSLIWANFRIATNNFQGLNNDWGHIMVIPFISIALAYAKRDELAQTPLKANLFGLILLLIGIFGFALGIYPGRNHMMQAAGMITSLYGLVLLTMGGSILRIVWFPIAFLAFFVKVSDIIWEHLAWQLQLSAASLSTFVLRFFAVFFNFEPTNRGSTIEMSFMQEGVMVTEALNVAEACAGLRMLTAFIALGVLVAFLGKRLWWQRLIICLSTIPIAVGINVGRVTALGLLFLVNPEWTRGEAHTLVGMLMLIPAFAFFLLLGWILDKIIIQPEEDPASQAQRTPHPAERDLALDRNRAPYLLKGLGIGAALMLLLGVGYGLFMISFDPSRFIAWATHGLVYAAMALTLLILAGTIVLLLKLMPRSQGNDENMVNRRMVALGVACGVLLVAFAGKQQVLAFTEVVLIKKPIELRHELYWIPNRIENWQRVGQDQIIPRDQLQELGTDKYLSRVYEDVNWPANEPGRAIRLHLAYYTGTPDVVPHVPDRCFVAGGAVPRGQGFIDISLDPARYMPDPESDGYIYNATLERIARVPALAFSARSFRYGESPNPEQQDSVFYFFAANGRFFPWSHDLRLYAFDPRDEYSYYCKIEVQVLPIGGRNVEPQVAVERVNDLLTVILPEIMSCLPDWVEVQRGNVHQAVER